MVAKYEPRILIEFTVDATTYRYCTETLYDPDDNCYLGTLEEMPQIRDRLADRFYGTQASETIQLIFGNRAGTWDTIVGSNEIRGTEVIIKYYDPANAEGVAAYESGIIIGLEDGAELGLEASMVKTLGTAKIQQWDIRDEAVITVELNSMDALNTLLPKKVINTTDFPYATDLGEPVRIVFGMNYGIWLPYFHYDYTNNYFDYGPIYGPIQDITSVYRDGKLANPDDYTVYTGHQGSPHAGYAFVRFNLEQCDSNGSFLKITADIYGYPRDFAYAMRDILEDDTWGLGETVNQNSFTAAKADLQSIGDYYCDGVIDQQRPARDILDELAFCCRGDYSQNAQGEWQLFIDKYSTEVAATFGDEDGYYNNILDVLAWNVPPANQATKTYTLKYGKNKEGVFYENTRSILSFGIDAIDETAFIQDHTTADKLTFYRSKLAEYDNELIILVGMEGEDLSKGQIIAVDIPARSIDENRKIEEIVRGSGSFQIKTRPHNSYIYGYSAGDMPSNSDEDIPVDYRETAPDSPVGLSVVAIGSKQGEDGTTFGYIELYTQRPNEKPNFKQIVFGYKRSTESRYTLVDGFNSSGLAWRCQIEGLIPGATYDFIAYQENTHGLLSTASNPTLQDDALGDSTAPDEPTGASVTSPTLINAIVSWTNPSDADFSHALVYRHTSDAFGSASIVHSEKGGPGEAEQWSDTDISARTTYYYWLVAVDFSGNESGEVSVGSITIGDSIDDLNHGFPDSTELTIAGGEITLPDTYKNFRHHTIDTQADAADDELDKINGGNVGELLLLAPEHADRTVIVKDGADIPLVYDDDYYMDDIDKKILLICTATDVWEEVLRSYRRAGFGEHTELTIAAGEITVTGEEDFRYNWIDTEADAATDELDKINGGKEGEILILHPAFAATRVITVVDSADISLGYDENYIMNDSSCALTLICTAPDVWEEISRVIEPVGFSTSTELTIAAGEITVTGYVKFRYHTVDTQADAASDELDIINGGNVGEIMILRAENSGRTIVLKDGANLILQGDFSLDSSSDSIVLLCHASGVWVELSRSHNA